MAGSQLKRRPTSFSSGAQSENNYRDIEYNPETISPQPQPTYRARPQPLPTPTRSSIISHITHQNLLASAPASPPTPAPSPTPQLNRLPTWSTAGENEDVFLRNARPYFSGLDPQERQRFLAEILNLCDSQQLGFVMNYVSPRLKKDPFRTLPNELCLRILSFVDDPRTLARASQVSKAWHSLLSDDLTWKNLCESRRFVLDSDIETFGRQSHNHHHDPSLFQPVASRQFMEIGPQTTTTSGSNLLPPAQPSKRPPPPSSYKSHFKQRYMVETAWKTGGKLVARHTMSDHGVVTSLHLTPDYIIIALDNAKIHVFDADGNWLRPLTGHEMGVWAIVPWGDTLVSGGCDREVRVWDMKTGECKKTLHGHTSTVRCLKMSDHKTAISGSRDTTLRIWDIEKGVCVGILNGHQASVRCLEIHGDMVVSGSYDATAIVWSISKRAKLRTLNGHVSQIYAISFDGNKIATGSLDTTVRVWDPHTGACLSVLQGHTSLVGQLQMRGNTLVTGGSDGSVRVWSLEKSALEKPNTACVHRLAAHDNSVTSLQFDEVRIVSGGSDGKVRVWDLRTGAPVRELSTLADAVWRIGFEQEKAVILASRQGTTTMEVYSFSPPPESLNDFYRASSPSAMSEQSVTVSDDAAMHDHDDEESKTIGIAGSSRQPSSPTPTSASDDQLQVAMENAANEGRSRADGS